MAHGLVRGKTLKIGPEELPIEWPESREESFKFWLSIRPPHYISYFTHYLG